MAQIQFPEHTPAASEGICSVSRLNHLIDVPWRGERWRGLGPTTSTQLETLALRAVAGKNGEAGTEPNGVASQTRS